jgi:AraC-like DNA-binding protein
MPQHDATQIARSPLLLLSYAEQHGLSRDELMRDASLSPEDLADPDSRIPVASMHKLWRAVIAHNNDPALGLKVGQTVTAKRLGLVGYVMNCSDDLLDALLQLSRYARLISDLSQFRIARIGDSISVRASVRPDMVALRHPIDASMTSVLTVAREITRSDVKPREVRLPSPPPASVEPYRTVFGGTVTFASPSAEMIFTTQQMATPVKARDELLSNYLNELAESKLRALGERDNDFIDSVRRGIWTTLQHGKPSLYRTATSLGMSGRTLQRRLGEHGTSFSMVLEQLRRELSAELRENKGFAASEVAFLLGYSEPSAYQRAVRRWRDSGSSQAS